MNRSPAIVPWLMLFVVAIATATSVLLLLPALMVLRYFPGNRVYAAVGIGIVLAVAPMIAAWRSRPRAESEAGTAKRVRAAGTWAACGLGMLVSFAAIVAVSETLSLRNMIFAQMLTSLHVVKQPIAAWVFVVSAAIVPPFRQRIVQTILLIVLAAIGATLFLAGPAGPGLPGILWLVLKTALVSVLIIALREYLRRVPETTRAGIAWAAAGVGVINLTVAVIQVAV